MSYFKPLRRKIGVATLGSACVLALVWVRSLYYGDACLTHRSSVEVLFSGNGELRWMAWESGSRLVDEIEFGLSPTFVLRSFEVTRDNLKSQNTEIRELRLSYFAIVIPLTLLSAWLFLSNPRIVKLESTKLPPKSEP